MRKERGGGEQEGVAHLEGRAVLQCSLLVEGLLLLGVGDELDGTVVLLLHRVQFSLHREGKRRRERVMARIRIREREEEMQGD